ncbi:TPA: hypothetical protein JG951_003171 [Enterobacter hormaechei subsp. steigerwaltii]|nr:hypothetical protein [Enterobacter hormaechei subsp. steigerwaltii]
MKKEAYIDRLKAGLNSLVEKDNRSKTRRNELSHRQKVLFKLLNEAIARYSNMGFSIVFTGVRNLECYSAVKNEKIAPFFFPLPVFSIVFKVPGFKGNDSLREDSECLHLLPEEVTRFRFTPEVNGNGGITYRFIELIPGKPYHASGDLSWQSKGMLDDGEYWFFSVNRAEGLQNRAVDLGCVEEWLARMLAHNAMTPTYES